MKSRIRSYVWITVFAVIAILAGGLAIFGPPFRKAGPQLDLVKLGRIEIPDDFYADGGLYRHTMSDKDVWYSMFVKGTTNWVEASKFGENLLDDYARSSRELGGKIGPQDMDLLARARLNEIKSYASEKGYKFEVTRYPRPPISFNDASVPVSRCSTYAYQLTGTSSKKFPGVIFITNDYFMLCAHVSEEPGRVHVDVLKLSERYHDDPNVFRHDDLGGLAEEIFSTLKQPIHD